MRIRREAVEDRFVSLSNSDQVLRALLLQAASSGGALVSAIDTYLGNTAWRAAPIAVGGLYVSIDPTNPASTLGYGTWEAFGAGRFLVSLDSSDTDFDTVLETGGAKTA